jgi:hypothetical protein
VETSATPRPDADTVRKVLLSALSKRGLNPQAGWVSVRLVNWPRDPLYTVLVAYEPARLALAGVLKGYHSSSTQNDALGFWVLDESEARSLCEGASPDGA